MPPALQTIGATGYKNKSKYGPGRGTTTHGGKDWGFILLTLITLRWEGGRGRAKHVT